VTTILCRTGLVTLCALALAACATHTATETPAASTDTTALYQQNCARCHGEQGGGKFGLLMKLTQVDLTEEQIRERIRTGRGRMPAFDQLSDAQTSALARRVVSFRNRPMMKRSR